MSKLITTAAIALLYDISGTIDSVRVHAYATFSRKVDLPLKSRSLKCATVL